MELWSRTLALLVVTTTVVLSIPLTNQPKSGLSYRNHPMNWTQYHRLADIHEFLDYLAKAHPTHVRVISIGKSHEGRELKLIRISKDLASPASKAVFIDGGIHAREWISPATVTYFINQLVENFDSQNDDIKNIDWYILPVLNPDGYEYSHVSDRGWRKNRRPDSTNGNCPGVDLNRNFGYKWGGEGTSNSTCSEVYRGTSAFSEPESIAVRDFFKSSSVKFNAYLTYHSYSQVILYPWGYADVLPPDHEELHAAGNAMAAGIKSSGNDIYKVGSSTKLLGAAAGGSDDWAKSFGVKYSYTIELNDEGKYGFVLPPEFILPVAKENFDGLKAFIAFVNKA